MSSSPRGGRRRAKPRPQAPSRRNADKYELYQLAVQAPEHDVEFLTRVGLRHGGRKPLRLREDFCGTGLLSAQWVRSDPRRQAWGVDLDPEPLAWGEARNRGPLGDDAARMHLVQGDVLATATPRCDVLVAPNFSFFCFHERELLLRYFRAARKALRPGGVFVADVFGGPEGMEELQESRRVRGFTYTWEQSRFDPITNRMQAHITFAFRDGSRMRRAFSYDWRTWGLAELRDVLAEAGFAETHVYWELTGSDGRGTGVFRRMEHAAACDSFVCALVAVTPGGEPARAPERSLSSRASRT